ncbi:ATP-dependent RNA helicase DbpA [Paenalcaligenes hermetiae]|uniref:ATP-dependent RNA helicase DbpA n=1 Tax=Paenalcaligenes hermetiae TaxID=1157987 RepID=A0ABP9M8U9_9BURK
MTAQTLFSTLALQPALLDTVTQLGWQQMTPVQAQSLPPILEGRDVIAQAKTGSGKTAAFALGVLQQLDTTLRQPQALVLCPTRELAAQVAEEMRQLARAMPNCKIMTLTGGTPVQRQADSLAHGVHIVVGTPGRVLDHLERQSLDVSAVSMLVLDEADRMIDMGFYDEMSHIEALCPRQRQTLLFSATYPDHVDKDATRFVRDAIHVQVQTELTSVPVQHYFYAVAAEERFDAVVRLLLHHQPTSALLFCNTKLVSDQLCDYLRSLGFSALALHGDLDQRQRDEVLIQFANHSCSILVATDVAARGLDIQGLPVVINVELPHQVESYIHRIGRTGRADQTGVALSFFEAKDKPLLQLLQQAGIDTGVGVLPPASRQARPHSAPMKTVVIIGGKRDKLRPGDILGALTGDAGLDKDHVGKIQVGMVVSHVAIATEVAALALDRLLRHGIKGKRFKAHFVRNS